MTTDRLRQAFRALAVERIELLQAALAELRRGQGGAGDTLRRLAQSLRGLAASHGFPEVATAAAAVADASDASDAAVAEHAQALNSALRATVGAIPAETRSVLVVDDDAVMTMLLTATLSSTERSVVVAETWREARALLATMQPLLIVLDLVLPDTDGRNAIVSLRENAATALTPIVVVSGVLGDTPRAECLALGATAYVVKPFSPKALATVVDDALRAAASAATPAVSVSSMPEVAVIRAPGPVLLAEDDPVVATLVIERLKRAGLEVVHCESGTDAAAMLKTRGFSCAILDIKLPGLDGFAVLSALRAEALSRHTPVAMLTGMGQEKDVTRGFELGADDYIVKPFSPRELAARVRRLIERAEAAR